MPQLRRTGIAVAIAGAAALGVGTVGVLTDFQLAGANPSSNAGSNSNNGTPPPKALTVKQTGFTPIAPGVTGTITLQVTNPNNQAVVLSNVTAKVTSVTKASKVVAGCSASWFTITDWTGSLPIGANKAGSVELDSAFSNETFNQDVCKGVTYNFSFTATGRQS